MHIVSGKLYFIITTNHAAHLSWKFQVEYTSSYIHQIKMAYYYNNYYDIAVSWDWYAFETI